MLMIRDQIYKTVMISCLLVITITAFVIPICPTDILVFQNHSMYTDSRPLRKPKDVKFIVLYFIRFPITRHK